MILKIDSSSMLSAIYKQSTIPSQSFLVMYIQIFISLGDLIHTQWKYTVMLVCKVVQILIQKVWEEKFGSLTRAVLINHTISVLA